LALRLAEATGDRKLWKLLDLAVASDSARWATRGGRIMTLAERWETRADRWHRVWAHLAGKDVALMGSRARRPAEGHAWVTAQIAAEPGLREDEAASANGWEITAGVAGVRVSRPTPAARALHLKEARKLAGIGWSEASWGELGSRLPSRTWRGRLPPGKRAAVRLAQEHIRAALREARANLTRHAWQRDAGARRMRLDHHLRQVVVYMLLHGYGELKRRGWRRAARVLFDLADVPPIGFDDFAEARAVKRDYQAARELVNLAKSRPAP